MSSSTAWPTVFSRSTRSSQITYWNRAAEEITGYTAEEAIGRQCHEVFRASLCGAECPMRRALASGQAAGPADVEILTREGSELTVSVSAAALQGPRWLLPGGGGVVPRYPGEAPHPGFCGGEPRGRRHGLAQRGDATRSGHPARGGPLRCAGADPRSERFRQGVGRPSHPPPQPAQCGCLPQAQWRSHQRRSGWRGETRPA